MWENKEYFFEDVITSSTTIENTQYNLLDVKNILCKQTAETPDI